MEPTSGTVEVFGQNVGAMSAREKIAFRGKTLGFIFQDHNLLPSLTAAENVAVPLLINRVPRAQAIAKATEMLDKVGLGDRTRAMPSQLSGGQQQRVAIARAMVHEPKLIVCDEPTSALDHDTGHKVMQLLRDVALGPDRALVIVTHDARIFQFADRIAKMDDGRVIKIVNSPDEM
jgi:putative ABC transport system ATP-binding protein